MNVVRFDVEVAFTPEIKERAQGFCKKYFFTKWIKFEDVSSNRPAIKEFICEKFRNGSDNSADYLTIIKTKWDTLPNGKIKALCSSQYIVGSLNPSKIHCFIFHSDTIASKDKISLEVIVLSEIENIDHCVSVVFEEIERQLSGCDVKPLVENFVFLFPYDRKGKDIWDTDYRIRAKFSDSLFTSQEFFRALIIGGITLLLIVAMYFGHFSETVMGWLGGTTSSCGLFLMTEFLLKHYRPRFVRGKPLAVTINNLSTVVDDPPLLPFADAASGSLHNPQINK